jgi:hypothetical protein
MRVRVRGVPFRGDAGYWRLGYWVPCDDWVALEVDAEALALLRGLPELVVEVLESSMPDGVGDGSPPPLSAPPPPQFGSGSSELSVAGGRRGGRRGG